MKAILSSITKVHDTLYTELALVLWLLQLNCYLFMT